MYRLAATWARLNSLTVGRLTAKMSKSRELPGDIKSRPRHFTRLSNLFCRKLLRGLLRFFVSFYLEEFAMQPKKRVLFWVRVPFQLHEKPKHVDLNV